MTRPGISPLALAMLVSGTALAGLACTGAIGDKLGGPAPGPGNGSSTRPPPTPPPPSTPVTADDNAGRLPLRRLTINEYNNTVRDLVGMDAPVITASTGVSQDIEAFEHGFLNGATVGSANDARLYSQIADSIATAAMTRLGSLMPQGCAAPAAGAEEGCAKKFIDDFGLRAFRRPPTTEEKADLLALYTRLRGERSASPSPRRLGR